jgi:hypothetical protein
VKIDVVEEAQKQFAFREAWWRANRDAQGLFEEEYEQAIEHLSTSPRSGDQYRVVRGKLIRRWLMKKAQCHIYYCTRRSWTSLRSAPSGARSVTTGQS